MQYDRQQLFAKHASLLWRIHGQAQFDAVRAYHSEPDADRICARMQRDNRRIRAMRKAIQSRLKGERHEL